MRYKVEILSAEVSLVNYSLLQDSDGQLKAKAIITHEFGHVLGYIGHDTVASETNPSIMNYASGFYYQLWHIDLPTIRDFNHLTNNDFE